MIDRSVDMLTPFMRQETYMGKLDEAFGVECNTCSIRRTIIKPEITEEDRAKAAAGKLKEFMTLKLYSEEDSLLKKFRDGNFKQVGTILTETGRLLDGLKNFKSDGT